METVELSFFIHLYIYSFSPLTAGRRDEDKKWNINLRSTLKYIFFPIFRFGNWWTRHKGLKEKNEWFIRPSTDHRVLIGVAQWFNLTLAWKKGNMSRSVIVKWDSIWLVSRYLAHLSLYQIASSARGQDEVNPVFWLATWAGMMGPPSPPRDSLYWSHARKPTKFVTFGQCLHIHKKKKKLTILLSLLCCKHSWISLSALEINGPFLILIKVKSFAIQWIL